VHAPADTPVRGRAPLNYIDMLVADGVHGVEMMYTCLGTGCETVSRTSAEDVDVCVGTWKDGRIGVYRGSRTSPSYGGTVFTAGAGAGAIGNADGGCE
jgi:hypothetical protein